MKKRDYVKSKSKSKSKSPNTKKESWNEYQKGTNIFEKDFCSPVKKEIKEYQNFGSIDFEKQFQI